MISIIFTYFNKNTRARHRHPSIIRCIQLDSIAVVEEEVDA